MNVAINLTNSSEPEKYLYFEIILPTISEESSKYVYPQFKLKDDFGRERRIDFAIITDNSKVAIELDGYTYHAKGKISPEKFSDDLQRQNELILSGWKVIRFSWDQLNQTPEKCKDTLRRAIISDIALHPYLHTQSINPHQIQKEALIRLENSRKAGAKKGLVVMATGLGKTFLSAFDAKKVGGRILFIVHNNSILEQAREAFLKIMPEKTMGFFNSIEKICDKDIVFANISSLRIRKYLEKFNSNEFDYIIIDEVHHGATSHYKEVIKHFQPKFMLGMTATPNRTDNQSIISILDNNLIYEITQNEAIQRGFLVPFYYYALKDNIDYSNIRHNGYRYYMEDLNKALIIKRRDNTIIEKYKEMTRCGKAIAFCVSIEHAERAAEHFNESNIPSVAIHSRIDSQKRQELIRGFRENKYKVVFVRDIFNEGIDFPDVEVLIFMRPTESKIIFTQQLGRGLRLNAAKSAVQVLDFIGNYINADKIIEYLSAYGNTFEVDDLRHKPIFYYDNGCRVTFERAAIDVITILKANVPSDSELVEHFFSVYKKLGRCPTIADIQRDDKYKMKHYLERYGNWQAFLDRILVLDNTIDLKSLELSTKLDNTEIEEYANLLEQNESQFINLLQQLAQVMEGLENDFVSLSYKLYKNKTKKIYEKLNDFSDKAKMAEGLLKEIILILGFRFESPNIVTKKPQFESKYNINDIVADVIKNLTSILEKKEIYLFARHFGSKLSIIKQLLETIQKYISTDLGNDLILLNEIYFQSLQISGVITNLLSESIEIRDLISEELGFYL